VQAWGYNGAGQLGDGTYSYGTANPSPVQVTGLGSVTQISAGANFSLAIHQVLFIQLPSIRATAGRQQK
jgi:alpha-tubulin suppressor-like RCC1 family protein